MAVVRGETARAAAGVLLLVLGGCGGTTALEDEPIGGRDTSASAAGQGATEDPNGQSMGSVATGSGAMGAGASSGAGSNGTQVAVGSSAGPAAAVDATELPPGACDAPNRVFRVAVEQGGCDGVACHISGLFPPDLQSPGVTARLLNVTAQLCPERKYIDSTNVEHSLMWEKVNGTQTCGERMPFASLPLGGDALECIRSWLWAVALQ